MRLCSRAALSREFPSLSRNLLVGRWAGRRLHVERVCSRAGEQATDTALPRYTETYQRDDRQRGYRTGAATDIPCCISSAGAASRNARAAQSTAAASCPITPTRVAATRISAASSDVAVYYVYHKRQHGGQRAGRAEVPKPGLLSFLELLHQRC